MSTPPPHANTPTRIAVDQAARLTALLSQHQLHLATPNPVLAIGVLEEVLLLVQDMEEEGDKINGSAKDLVIAQNEYAVKLVQELPTQKTQKKTDPDAAAEHDTAVNTATYYLHKAMFLTSVETNVVVGDPSLRRSLRGLTMNNLGFVFMADGKPRVALGWLTKVVRMESGDDAQSEVGGAASTHVNIATCLGLLGRNKEAMRHAKFAVKTLLLEQAEQSEQAERDEQRQFEQRQSARVEKENAARKAAPHNVAQATTQRPAIAQDDMFSPPAAKANTIGIFGRELGDPMDGDPMDGDPMDGDPMDGDPMDGDPMDGDPMGDSMGLGGSKAPPVGRGIDVQGQATRRPRQGSLYPAVGPAPQYFEPFGEDEVMSRLEAGHEVQAAPISVTAQILPRTRDRIANTNRGRLSLLASAYFNLAVFEEKSRKGEDALKHYGKAVALAEGGVLDMFKRAEGECRKRMEAELGKRKPKKPEPVKPKKSLRAPAGVARVGRNIVTKKPEPVKPKKSPRVPAGVARVGRNVVIKREVVVVDAVAPPMMYGVVNLGAEEEDSSITVSSKDPSKERNQSTDKSEKATEDNSGGVVIVEMEPFASPTEAQGNAVEAVAISVEGVALGEVKETEIMVAEAVKVEENAGEKVIEGQDRSFGQLLASPPTAIASPSRGPQDCSPGQDIASLTPASPNAHRMSGGVTIGESVGGVEVLQVVGGLGVASNGRRPSVGVTIGQDGYNGLVVGTRTPPGARTPSGARTQPVGKSLFDPSVGKSPFHSKPPLSASANQRLRVSTVGKSPFQTPFESPSSSSNTRNKAQEGKESAIAPG